MRKFLSFFVVMSLVFGSMQAAPVDIQTAKKVAENYYKHYAPEAIKNFGVKNVFTNEYNGLTTFYMFTFNEGGFVLVSADDAVIPVLGYSHEGVLNSLKFNPVAESWISQYSKSIEQIVTSKLSNEETRVQWNDILAENFPKNGRAVAPLFNITWGQETGYNTYCPANTPVGCVATAMAMIIRHYQYPATGASWHRYKHPVYGNQTAFFFDETYNYAEMPTNTGSPGAAKLGYHLGVAVEMNYGPEGSGAYTFDVPFVMANYFKYDQGIQYHVKQKYSDNNWKQLLKTELDNSRPILYAGSSQQSGGHAFVCIGYNDNGQFYFNWGWDGQSNGYFSIGNLNPAAWDFNQGNQAVIGIKPPEAGQEKFLWVRKFSSFPNKSTYPRYISAVNDRVAWMVGGDGSGNNLKHRVYAVTSDGGATWTSKKLNYGDDFAMIQGISDNTAFIVAFGSGSANKILKTTDRGTTWTPILSGESASSFFNTVHFFDENNGLVQGDQSSGYHEIFTTTDGGATWTRVPQANIPAPVSAQEYGIVGHYTAVGNTLWWTTNNGFVYKTEDKGLTWTKHLIYTPTAGTSVNIEIAFSDDAQTGLVNSSEGQNVQRKFRTTDGGVTWTEIASPSDQFYGQGLSAVPGKTGMFVSTGANAQANRMGISYSVDGGLTWQNYAQYYTTQQYVSVAMVSETKGFVGTFSDDNTNGVWVLGGTANIAADFSVDINTACVEQEVTFTNKSFGSYTAMEWNFGEGATPATANTEGPHVVRYSTSGKKTVVLSITAGAQTLTETKNDLVEVIGLPTAAFTFKINQGLANIVDFDASTSTGLVSGAKYVWDMGNGTILKRPTPKLLYNYPALGVYQVTLTVENIEGGCSNSVTQTVDNSTSIADRELKELVIYPNPASDKLTIANVNGAQIFIYSIDGRLVHQATATSDTFEVNTTTFNTGLYSVKIVGVSETVIQTVAIQ